jgi:deuterolysin
MHKAEKVDFDGVRVWLDIDSLTEENFQTIAAGETVVVEFDIALDHDLSSGGEFDISSAGALSYAEADSLTLAGSAGFRSNVVHATVDGEAAAKVRRDYHEALARRAVVQSDCTGTRRTQTINGLSNCAALARAAATAASSGPAARMTEFFKSSTAATRSTVAGVFNRIASECGSSTSGVSRQFCTDVYPGGACSGGTVAYTYVPRHIYSRALQQGVYVHRQRLTPAAVVSPPRAIWSTARPGSTTTPPPAPPAAATARPPSLFTRLPSEYTEIYLDRPD